MSPAAAPSGAEHYPTILQGNLIARVERGERIVVARTRKAVAALRAVRKMKKRSVPLDDPLLRVDEYSYDGPIGPTTNRDIDSTIVDIWPSVRRQPAFFAIVAMSA